MCVKFVWSKNKKGWTGNTEPNYYRLCLKFASLIWKKELGEVVFS